MSNSVHVRLVFDYGDSELGSDPAVLHEIGRALAEAVKQAFPASATLGNPKMSIQAVDTGRLRSLNPVTFRKSDAGLGMTLTIGRMGIAFGPNPVNHLVLLAMADASTETVVGNLQIPESLFLSGLALLYRDGSLADLHITP